MKKFELVVIGHNDNILSQTLLSNCDKSDPESWIKEEAQRNIDQIIDREFITIKRWYIKTVDVIIDQIY